jgi:hypothetical protein
VNGERSPVAAQCLYFIPAGTTHNAHQYWYKFPQAVYGVCATGTCPRHRSPDQSGC